MIGVFVIFRYGDNFDEQSVRKIAEAARAKFEGLPGLRSKAFTLNSAKHEATNVYIWDSEDAAKAFFTDELLERVTKLYGVRPTIEFVHIAALVENIRATSPGDAANSKSLRETCPLHGVRPQFSMTNTRAFQFSLAFTRITLWLGFHQNRVVGFLDQLAKARGLPP